MRWAMIAQTTPITPRRTQARTLALVKTALVIAHARRAIMNAAITNAARSRVCQSGVIGTLMMAWAQMDGTKERVQAKKMPNPRDKMISAAMREMLYAFSLRYWLCVKTNSSEVPMMAGPLPQSSASRRW